MSKPVQADELEKIRSEFVRFQYNFNAFSDHYMVVALFAQHKVAEALANAPAPLKTEVEGG